MLSQKCSACFSSNPTDGVCGKRSEQGNSMFFQEDDVIVEESSLSASEGELDGEMERDGSEDDIRELRARRHALAHKLAQQQKRRDKIQVSQCFSFIVHLRPTFYTSVEVNVLY